MEKVKIPASIKDALDQLSGLAELVRAKEWHRAAIVAAFVRLDIGGGPRSARNRPGTRPVYSATEFEEFGITGLTNRDTVSLYVQRWLDANDGKYPEPGKQVALPTKTWPPTTLDDPRTAGVKDREAIMAAAAELGTGAAKALDVAKNKAAMTAAIKGSHAVAQAALAALPPEMLAEAVRRPEVADAVVRDPVAGAEAIRASGRMHPEPTRPQGNGGFLDDGAQALANALLDIGLLLVVDGSKELHGRLVGRPLRETEWLPGMRERVIEGITESQARLADVMLVLTSEVTDEGLRDLLKE